MFKEVIDGGHLHMLKYFETLKPPRLPSPNNIYYFRSLKSPKIVQILQFFVDHGIALHGLVADRVARDGRLDILERFSSHLNLSIVGMQKAAENGHRHILEYVINTRPYLQFNSSVANWAASGGHIDILDLLESLNPPIRADLNGANLASQNGHLEILRRLRSYTPSVVPTQAGIGCAIKNGHLHIVQEFGMPHLLNIVPTFTAPANGHVHILQYLNTLNPPYICTDGDLSEAAKNGRVNVLEYLESLPTPIRPINNNVVMVAACNGHLNVIKYFDKLSLEKNIHPPIRCTSNELDAAIEFGHTDIAIHILNYTPPVYPSREGITLAYIKQMIEVIERLEQLGV